jgi:sn-glycerol 3-phosphate transport system permease protein
VSSPSILQSGGPSAAAGSATDPRGPTAPRRRFHRESLLAWGFLAPSAVVFVVFLLYPLGRTVYLSMHGNDIVGRPSRFVGLSHFAEMASPEFGRILLTTLLFTVGVVVPGVVGALAVPPPAPRSWKGSTRPSRSSSGTAWTPPTARCSTS